MQEQTSAGSSLAPAQPQHAAAVAVSLSTTDEVRFIISIHFKGEIAIEGRVEFIFKNQLG